MGQTSTLNPVFFRTLVHGWLQVPDPGYSVPPLLSRDRKRALLTVKRKFL